MSDHKALIESLGGATKLAERLGYDKQGGVQRVQNWTVRGVPPKVQLAHPEIFYQPPAPITAPRRASDPTPAAAPDSSMRLPASRASVIECVTPRAPPD